ncbi:MAG: DUF3006 domain-containing protein [Oscillospiraceae bacterium]|nr:DUF3006 domain-containing protein [Oscillospiraceae bacterium]
MIVINFTVDRIVDNIVVLITDDEEVIEVNVSKLPFEISEGDILTGEIGDELIINHAEKAIRTERINNLFEKLKKRGNKK